MKLNLDLKSLVALLAKVRTFAITLTVIAVVGYTLYLIGLMAIAGPDQKYLEHAKGEVGLKSVSLDPKSIDLINSLITIDGSVDLSRIGRSDPFSP